MKKKIVLLILISFLVFFISACNKKEKIPKNPKIYILGLDGADWDIIDPLIKQGKLKFFKKLKEESAWAKLKTFKPTLSAVVWTSIATGDTMVKHGIVDWLFVKENNIKVPYSNAEKRVPSIWEIFDSYNESSIVLHWFVTYPPDHIKGVMVSDTFSVAMSEVFLSGKDYKEFKDTVYPEFYYYKLYRLFKEDIEKRGYDYKKMVEYLEIPDYIEKYKKEYHKETTKGIPILSNWRRYILKDFIAEKTLYYFLRKGGNYNLFLWYSRMPDVFKHFGSLFMDRDYLKKIKKILADKQPISDSLDKEFETKMAPIVEPILKHKEKILKAVYEKVKKENAYLFILSDHGFTLGPKGYDHHGLPKDIPAPNGILMILGPGVKKGKEIKASVLDITPTALYLSGKPVGKDMDGKVLLDAFNFNRKIKYTVYKKSKKVKGKKNKEINKKIMEDLKTIGYI